MKGIQSYFMRRLSQLSDWCQNMLTNYSWPSHMINKFNMCTVVYTVPKHLILRMKTLSIMN